MPNKKKKSVSEDVERRLFSRASMRKVVARDNLDEALKHTKKVLRKARLSK